MVSGPYPAVPCPVLPPGSTPRGHSGRAWETIQGATAPALASARAKAGAWPAVLDCLPSLVLVLNMDI